MQRNRRPIIETFVPTKCRATPRSGDALRRLAEELSDEYMARTVADLATAYEDEAARVETAMPP